MLAKQQHETALQSTVTLPTLTSHREACQQCLCAHRIGQADPNPRPPTEQPYEGTKVTQCDVLYEALDMPKRIPETIIQFRAKLDNSTSQVHHEDMMPFYGLKQTSKCQMGRLPASRW